MSGVEGVWSYLINLGRMEYPHSHRFQTECVAWRLDDESRPDLFLLTEHPPVFTLGSRGGLDSLTVSREHIERQGLAIVQTERGGDITYHGPGQLVVYPVIHLRLARLSVTAYVDRLEEAMIGCCRDFGISSGRDRRNRGVWVGDNKIGSIGIRVRHGVTFHGLALNVDPSFQHFGWIRPCGLSRVGVTSICREAGRIIDGAAVRERMIYHLEQIFGRTLVPVAPSVISGEAA
ncbi:MAG: lipoyl(octanoyl) transferase LipB [Desulfofustis sp.]|nr:lipoyl(octanoyl) transferase LipB [Desulfofustis sp.]